MAYLANVVAVAVVVSVVVVSVVVVSVVVVVAAADIVRQPFVVSLFW